MKRYEAAGGVLSELCTLLSKEKELYEKKRKAEEEAQRKAEVDACKKAKQEVHRKEILSGKVELPGGHILEMVQIEPGTFTMGSPAGREENTFLYFTKTVGEELGRWDDEKQHQVTLTKRFYLGKYPVTQKEYQAVMGNNPSKFKGDNLPVEQVSWDDAKSFCSKLNDLKRNELPAGYRFDLPTEAQWEYACRAGTTTALNNGLNLTSVNSRCSNLEEVAWYDENSDGKTHPVGQKKPNAWGLYDMHGNVYEWCNDWNSNYPSRAVTDPTGPDLGSRRVIHGGSWYSTAQRCRSAFRLSSYPADQYSYVGFRVALVPVD
ncbi:MAG: SUMF1/EgtB/PvdO family nonheme iron enzyme [Lentisphaeria bacterium]|nr:SUMF1/EgtB/PvdO family nonheme iron enzyme [Lentisphaeria bacterium]